MSPWARLARLVLACALLALGLAPQSGLAAEETDPKAPAKAAGPGAPVVPSSIYAPNLAVITIEGPIDAMTSTSFRRRVKDAIDGGADAIVVELDTPGGEVGAALEICNEIKSCPKPTIAWINPDAYSAGAIIALACDEIVVSSNATMGDAAPILMGLGGVQSLDAIDDETLKQKQFAPLLAEIVDSARRNGYDEILVQGMLTLGVETWQVENTETGEIYFLTEREYRNLFGREPQRGTPMIQSGAFAQSDGKAGEAGSAENGPGGAPADTRDEGGDTAFRSASERLGEGVETAVDASLVTRSQRPDFSREDPDDYRVLGYATDGKILLTMKPDELRAFGFVDHKQAIDTDAQLKQYVGAQHLARLDMSWSEKVVGFMTVGMSGMIIKGVLIVVFMLALFVELSMPGIGVAGAIAVAALAGLIIPPMLIGAATWWALAAILGGIGLILLEVFVVPGFGIPGILGLIMLMAGLVGSFAGTGQLFPGTGEADSGLAWAVSTVLLACFAAGVGMFFISKYTRSIPIANRLVLSDRQSAGDEKPHEGLLAAMGASHVANAIVGVGDEGVTTTPLRPSGTAEFGDRLVDVVAEYGFVDSRQRVRVVSVTDYRVGVEAIEDASSGGEQA